MLVAPPAFVLIQYQTLYKWYLSLKSVKSCSLSTQSLASCVNYFWNCFKCFSKHIKVPYKFFDIVQFSRSCAPQPCGWRPVYFTTEVVFCQALFFRSFWTFWTWTTSNISVSAGVFLRLLVLFKGFLLWLRKSFFCLSAWRSSIIPHPRLLVNTFWQIFYSFFAFTPKQQQTAGKTAPQLSVPFYLYNVL